MLRLAGFESATAATARAGIDLALARTFDVILVDLRLPDGSGLAVVREMKRHRIGARIIILTAFPTLDSSFDAGGCGADGYVDGPLDAEEVVGLVRNALAGRVPVRHPRQSRSDPPDPLQSALDPRVRAVMRLIVSDLARPWSMRELSAAVDMSESGLRHLFHAALGISVSAFRTEHRLQESAWRLTTTHEGIRQVAYSLGWQPEDFRRAFRERFAMSARAYRAKFWRGPVSFA